MQNLKKSICIIVTKGNCGGAQQYVSMLANKAASVNWEVTVVIGDGGGFESLITDSRIKVIRQLGFSNKSILPDLLLLKWILKNRFRFSIFHFNSSKCLLIGWVLKLFSRKLKTIFTVHGVPWIARSPAILNRIPFVLFKFFLKSYDQIIFVSQFVSETILLNESVKIRYIYSIYYLVTTMISVGYGDIIPKNYIEIVFAVITMFCTGIIYAYSLNSIGNIISNINK